MNKKTGSKKTKTRPRRTGQTIPRPLIFISHRHKDKPLADVISRFLKARSGGRVDIFQSSGSTTKGPEIGKNLNQELMKYLWRASAIILVYTTADQDWSYCMWECGVAMDPESPDTKVILFQCSGRTPPLFAEQVRVDIRTLGSVHKFSKEFLTSTTFFPGYGKAISGFQENDQEVADAAQDLYERLQKVAPPEYESPIEEWPALPFLRLELSPSDVEAICGAASKRRAQVAASVIKRKSVISEIDKVALQLFGVPSLSPPKPFQELTARWERNNRRSKSKWLASLCSQITDGVLWDFPKLVLEPMPGPDNTTSYAPVLTHVRRSPTQSMEFDIYFYKFPADTKKSKPRGPRARR